MRGRDAPETLVSMNHSPDDKARSARAALLARAAELRDRLHRVRSDLRRERAPLPRDSADAAIVVENDEVLEALERGAARELELIDSALTRIEQGVFGLCVTCTDEIDAARIRTVPYALQCRECASDG
jgi:RNA polymerase-binding transcription factor